MNELEHELISKCPKNKGFKIVHDKFLENNFELTRNEDRALVYSNKNNQYDEFQIRVDMDQIVLSIPIINSNYSFRSTHKNYWDASEFLQMHLENYIKNQ
jgi:hypothetical protein|tara:strand:- start:886 stop:1185 length:300 start_codon:yes stop_codon:yes gene_type:complete